MLTYVCWVTEEGQSWDVLGNWRPWGSILTNTQLLFIVLSFSLSLLVCLSGGLAEGCLLTVQIILPGRCGIFTTPLMDLWIFTLSWSYRSHTPCDGL